MTPLQIRRACRKYAEKFAGLQSEYFQRLGVFGQWDDP
jgi:isoleucyl-tRNA synthetase